MIRSRNAPTSVGGLSNAATNQELPVMLDDNWASTSEKIVGRIPINAFTTVVIKSQPVISNSEGKRRRRWRGGASAVMEKV